MEMLILIIRLLVLDIAALRWGFRSIEPPDDPEWTPRRTWPGFGR